MCAHLVSMWHNAVRNQALVDFVLLFLPRLVLLFDLCVHCSFLSLQNYLPPSGYYSPRLSPFICLLLPCCPFFFLTHFRFNFFSWINSVSFYTYSYFSFSDSVSLFLYSFSILSLLCFLLLYFCSIRLLTFFLKIQVFQNVTSCWLGQCLSTYRSSIPPSCSRRRFLGVLLIFFLLSPSGHKNPRRCFILQLGPEDGGTTLLRNIGSFTPVDMT